MYSQWVVWGSPMVALYSSEGRDGQIRATNPVAGTNGQIRVVFSVCSTMKLRLASSDRMISRSSHIVSDLYWLCDSEIRIARALHWVTINTCVIYCCYHHRNASKLHRYVSKMTSCPCWSQAIKFDNKREGFQDKKLSPVAGPSNWQTNTGY